MLFVHGTVVLALGFDFWSNTTTIENIISSDVCFLFCILHQSRFLKEVEVQDLIIMPFKQSNMTVQAP